MFNQLRTAVHAARQSDHDDVHVRRMIEEAVIKIKTNVYVESC
jgi:hypothetical protein